MTNTSTFYGPDAVQNAYFVKFEFSLQSYKVGVIIPTL